MCSLEERSKRGKLGLEWRYTPVTLALQPPDCCLVLGVSPSDVLPNECGTLLKVAKNIAHGLPPHDCVCGFANRSTALVARL